MDRLLGYLIVRFEPRIGWPLALLLLGAATSPAAAALDGAFRLPATLLFWAGLLGALLGLRAARLPRIARYTLAWPAALALGALLIIAGGRALPPVNLIWADLAAIAGELGRWWRGEPASPALELDSLRFLAVSLPRLWGQLLAAPGAGEAGAALLLGSVSLAATLAGATCLGWATGAGRPTLAWSLPLLVALAGITILNASEGVGLLLGMLLLLLLAVVSAHLAREQAWERAGAAYSEELRWGAIGWGGVGGIVLIVLALSIPTSVPNALAELIWPAAELPSGIAAIERNVQRGRQPQGAEVGLSQLPALNLGVSLEQGPPETIALRVSMAPFAPGAWPRYWRARVLNRYDGRSWRADARTGPFGSPIPADVAPPGAIVQEVQDLNDERGLLLGLPNLIGLSVEANAERLPDGSLAAITGNPPGGRYLAFSLPQELAAPPSPDSLVDMSDTLAVPAGMPARVSELAATIAGDAGTTLERALALEAYLRELPYTYRVRPLPRGGDAVDQFLFEMREGYCTYYASAMALMARSLGIPARIAVGYATGSYDQAAGAYIVREADAHAWPELFIDGRWLPFEPTPVRPLPARGGAPAPSPEAELVPTPAPPEPAQPDTTAIALAGAALAGLVLIAVIGIIVARRRRSPLAAAQQRLERLGARAGVPWPTGSTLHEYARLIELRAGSKSRALRELVDLIELGRYSGRPLSPPQERALGRSLAELAAWLRRQSRGR